MINVGDIVLFSRQGVVKRGRVQRIYMDTLRVRVDYTDGVIWLDVAEIQLDIKYMRDTKLNKLLNKL